MTRFHGTCDHCGKPERFCVLCAECEQLCCTECARVECCCALWENAAIEHQAVVLTTYERARDLYERGQFDAAWKQALAALYSAGERMARSLDREDDHAELMRDFDRASRDCDQLSRLNDTMQDLKAHAVSNGMQAALCTQCGQVWVTRSQPAPSKCPACDPSVLVRP
jgi:predicted Zn-ribbon and HTH transcriptional regulator